MTWDIYALRPPPGTRLLDDISPDFEPSPIGTAEEILELVRKAAPHVDPASPDWLRLEGSDHSIEIGLGKSYQVRDVTFYISSGAGAPALIVKICRELGISAFDTESGARLTEDSTRPEPPPLDDDELAGPPKRKWWRLGSGAD